IAAARILGEFGSDFATPALVAALLDNEPKVRNAAAAALMQIGERPASAEQTPQPSPADESTPLLPPTQTVSDRTISVSAPVNIQAAYAPNEQSEMTDLQALLLNENSLRNALEQKEDRLLKATSELAEANKEIQVRTELALKFKSEAQSLRQQEAEYGMQAKAAFTLHETEIKLKAQADQARQTLSDEVTQL